MSDSHETSPAEQLLLEEGVVSNHSAPRREMLMCLGCRWLTLAQAGEPPVAAERDISQCTKVHISTVRFVTSQLIKADAATVGWEAVEPGSRQRPRRQVRPTETDLGKALWTTLELPLGCKNMQAKLPKITLEDAGEASNATILTITE